MDIRITHILRIKERIGTLIFCFVLFLASVCPMTVFAAETGKEQKTVRVGYVNVAAYEEGGEGEYKRGYGYEYLQKISYITGWKYEYVYGSFKECYEMLVNGDIDLFGNVSYKPERAELFDFASYPQGKDTYLLYTTKKHMKLISGNIQQMNGCKIGVTVGSFQEGLLMDWMENNHIQAEVVKFDGYDALMSALDAGELDAIATPDLSSSYDYLPIINIGFSDYYFAVSKTRPDILAELNEALYEIQSSELDYNNLLVSRYYKQMTNTQVLSKKEDEWLADHENTLRIGYLDDNLPYSTQLEDGEMGGVMKTIADMLEEKFGILVETKCYKTSRQYKEALEKGEVDVIGPLYGDFYLAELENYVLTNAFFSTIPVTIYKQLDFNINCATIAVANESLFHEEVLRILYPEAEILLCDGIEGCLNAVASGKADSTLVTSVRLNVLRKYPAMESLQFSDTPALAEICLATTKDNRVAAAILNKGITLSSDRLNGVVLAENSYVNKVVTFSDFVNAHMTAVLSLAGLIILTLCLMLYRISITRNKLEAALEKVKKEKEYSYKLKLCNNELEVKANQDALTQIGNRQFFLDKMSELLAANEKFTLCYCDLDNLKYINDTYGHSEGDYYIRNFVEIVKSHIRTGDIFARIGGDEFCIILRGCKYATGEKKIRQMKEVFHSDHSKEYPKNFCCGIIEVQEEHNENDVMKLLEQADAMMYEQKKEYKKMFQHENC